MKKLKDIHCRATIENPKTNYQFSTLFTMKYIKYSIFTTSNIREMKRTKNKENNYMNEKGLRNENGRLVEGEQMMGLWRDDEKCVIISCMEMEAERATLTGRKFNWL